MIADTRTSAGIDNISNYRKLLTFVRPGECALALASAGNLSISQSVVSLLREGLNNPDTGDVETLEAWGLVASTNSGGAQNWKPEFAEFFRSADVVILGDDDDAGRKRVEAVGLSLRGVAGRIRALGSWGGAKDVTDWKEAGNTADDLSAVIGKLADWCPAPPSSKSPHPTRRACAKAARHRPTSRGSSASSRPSLAQLVAAGHAPLQVGAQRGVLVLGGPDVAGPVHAVRRFDHPKRLTFHSPPP